MPDDEPAVVPAEAGSAQAAPAETLGRRLDLVASSIAGRVRQTYPWVGLLVPVLDRIAALDQDQERRFARHETPARPPQLQARRGRAPSKQVGRASAAEGPPEPPDTPAPRGRPLPADLRSPLRALVGDRVERLRVHDDPEADAVARARGADAVTVGVDVYFRGGKYQPDDRRGRALIAHETVHVAPPDEGTVALGEAQELGRLAREETRARAVERAVLDGADDVTVPVADHRPQGGSATHPVSGRTVPSPSWSRPGSLTGPTPANATSRTAEGAAGTTAPGGRPPGTAASTATARHADADRQMPAPATGVDLTALREDVLRDVMRRLRIESERGG